jgi:8-oxo-dGTP pyrophosphatase MutT (NUDIX family)
VTAETLHADATRLLANWMPPDEEGQETLARFRELLATEPGAARCDNPGAHLTASALVVHPDLDQVLLCLHGRANTWLQLGGHCEDEDTSIAAAALRESTEESGIPSTGLRIDTLPIDLDVHPVACRYGPSLHYDIRFVVLAPPGAVPVVSAESHQLGWFSRRSLPQPLGKSTDRLVEAAFERLLG